MAHDQHRREQAVEAGPAARILEGTDDGVVGVSWMGDGTILCERQSGQALGFLVGTDNDALFAALPQIDPVTGDLTYTPADDANGTTTVTVQAHDLAGGVTDERFSRRKSALEAVNDYFAERDKSDKVQAMDTFYDRAYSLISSPEARQAFDLDADDSSKDSIFAWKPIVTASCRGVETGWPRGIS